MKFFIFAILSTFLFTCSKHNNINYTPTGLRPLGVPAVDNYTPVSRAIITVKKTEDLVFIKAIKYLNPFPTAIAATTSTTVTYTSSPGSQITIDTTNLSPTLSQDTNTLDLGSFEVTQAKTNQVSVCGTGTQKCTSAVIRSYTQELSGYAGISGFVNTTDNYGIGVSAGDSNASSTVGLGASNSGILSSVTIAANKRKVSLTDFSSLVYNMKVDFSNAGAGDYEMDVVVELALGL